MASRRDIERLEHEQWMLLCKELKMAGAVTTDDLKASVNACATPGQFLLRVIRRWGELRAQLGVVDDG